MDARDFIFQAMVTLNSIFYYILKLYIEIQSIHAIITSNGKDRKEGNYEKR